MDGHQEVEMAVEEEDSRRLDEDTIRRRRDRIERRGAVVCDCEFLLDELRCCGFFSASAVIVSVLFVAFAVLLRNKVLGNESRSWLQITAPLTAIWALSTIFSAGMVRRKYIRADPQSISTAAFIIAIPGTIAAVIVLNLGALASTIMVAEFLDGKLSESITPMVCLSPLIAGTAFALAISLFCSWMRILKISLGIYQQLASYCLLSLQTFATVLIIFLVLISLWSNGQLDTAAWIPFLPLLTFHSFSILLCILFIGRELALGQSRKNSRLVDCCSLFTYVTPTIALSVPFFLLNINCLLIEVSICAYLEDHILARWNVAFTFLLFLPVSSLFTFICSCCSVFTSHNPFKYDYDHY